MAKQNVKGELLGLQEQTRKWLNELNQTKLIIMTRAILNCKIRHKKSIFIAIDYFFKNGAYSVILFLILKPFEIARRLFLLCQSNMFTLI